MQRLQKEIGFEGNVLYIFDKQVEFEFRINEAMIIDDIVWVQEGIPNEVYKVDNAYGVSMDGKVLMRIQPPSREIYLANNYDERMPYVGIGFCHEGYYTLFDFLGMRFAFNPKTGEIIKQLPSMR